MKDTINLFLFLVVVSAFSLSSVSVQADYAYDKEKIKFAHARDQAKNWWIAFEEANKANFVVVEDLAQELAKRNSTVEEFFDAYVDSRKATIPSILAYMDRQNSYNSEDDDPSSLSQIFATFVILHIFVSLTGLVGKNGTIFWYELTGITTEAYRQLRVNEWLEKNADTLRFMEENLPKLQKITSNFDPNHSSLEEAFQLQDTLSYFLLSDSFGLFYAANTIRKPEEWRIFADWVKPGLAEWYEKQYWPPHERAEDLLAQFERIRWEHCCNYSNKKNVIEQHDFPPQRPIVQKNWWHNLWDHNPQFSDNFVSEEFETLNSSDNYDGSITHTTKSYYHKSSSFTIAEILECELFTDEEKQYLKDRLTYCNSVCDNEIPVCYLHDMAPNKYHSYCIGRRRFDIRIWDELILQCKMQWWLDHARKITTRYGNKLGYCYDYNSSNEMFVYEGHCVSNTHEYTEYPNEPEDESSHYDGCLL